VAVGCNPRYRRMASGVTDGPALAALAVLAAEYDALADEIVRRLLIRYRAYAIWEEQGRLHGFHADHWLCAEAELAGAETFL
jgi:hypothetical protein